jgi:hypothetical protein
MVAAIGAFGCGHTTAVRPVPKDAVTVEAEVGGPLANVGMVIPVPLSTVGVRYGFHERGDVGASLHATSLAFGVVGADVGTTWLLHEEHGIVPAVASNGRLYAFTDTSVGGPRTYMELTPSVSWLLGDRYLTYASGSAFAQFAGGPPLFSAAVGEQVQLGRFALQLEARWYEPEYNTTLTVVNWMPMGGHGGFGSVLGVSYRLGGER